MDCDSEKLEMKIETDRIYRVAEIAELLSCGKTNAYALVSGDAP